MTVLTDLSALALAASIRDGGVSAREVVESHLERIAAVNADLRAVVRLSPSARTEADAADRALAAGQDVGPLHGVPFTVKDWIETRGLECDGGFARRRGRIPASDAPAVARLRRAGAVLLGKTRAGTDPSLHPLARNPRDHERTPGASSGGEASIIAAHASPLGVGSDSGGSLRWPAHCCGVAALKPTAGLVPLTGHVPPIVTLTDPRTVIGPLARSVSDLAAVLPILAGPDGTDPSAVPVMPGDPDSALVGELRVAWFADFPGVEPVPAVRAAVDRVVAGLRLRVRSMHQAAPPQIDEAMDITRAYWARPESTSLSEWRPWGPSTLSADEVEASLFRWDRLRRAFFAFMSDVDVIVCPVAADVAPRREQPEAEDYAFTVPFSLAGNPVVVVPAGAGDDGMPIGVQVAAAPFHDHVALAAARAIEQLLGC